MSQSTLKGQELEQTATTTASDAYIYDMINVNAGDYP